MSTRNAAHESDGDSVARDSQCDAHATSVVTISLVAQVRNRAKLLERGGRRTQFALPKLHAKQKRTNVAGRAGGGGGGGARGGGGRGHGTDVAMAAAELKQRVLVGHGWGAL